MFDLIKVIHKNATNNNDSEIQSSIFIKFRHRYRHSHVQTSTIDRYHHKILCGLKLMLNLQNVETAILYDIFILLIHEKLT